jgi:hypothetical protein
MIHQDEDACTLVRELDGLPLALATAGAYLYQMSISFANYLGLYNTSWLRLQQKTPELLSYEDRALYSTWNISLDHIKQQKAYLHLSSSRCGHTSTTKTCGLIFCGSASKMVQSGLHS